MGLQLIVALGSGEKGRRYRRLMELAAQRADMTLTHWARLVLLRAAVGAQEPVADVLDRAARLLVAEAKGASKLGYDETADAVARVARVLATVASVEPIPKPPSTPPPPDTDKENDP